MEVKRLTDRNIARLNFREPQHPPDFYYIKKSETKLQTLLERPTAIRDMISKGTPRYQERSRLFGMDQTHLDRMLYERER